MVRKKYTPRTPKDILAHKARHAHITVKEYSQDLDQQKAQHAHNSRNSGKPWTAIDDEFLREYIGSGPFGFQSLFYSDMGRLVTVLGRTPGAIKSRWNKLQKLDRDASFTSYPTSEQTQFERLAEAWRKAPRKSRLYFLKTVVDPELWVEAHYENVETTDADTKVQPPIN